MVDFIIYFSEPSLINSFHSIGFMRKWCLVTHVTSLNPTDENLELRTLLPSIRLFDNWLDWSICVILWISVEEIVYENELKYLLHRNRSHRKKSTRSSWYHAASTRRRATTSRCGCVISRITTFIATSRRQKADLTWYWRSANGLVKVYRRYHAPAGNHQHQQ